MDLEMFEQNILIIIPNVEHSKRIYTLLSEFGYKSLMVAEDIDQALEIINANQIEVIVSDVDLGEMDGWRFARLIRSGALSISEHTPIIIVSPTYSERIAEATARIFEVDNFIPFNALESLPIKLKEVLNSGYFEQQKATLLVVEDYADTVTLVKRILQGRFDIDVATTGKEGLEKWRAGQYDLVLLDVMLPEMPGNEVLKAIITEAPQQSVVMMTSRSTPERAGKLIMEGAVDFIAKPFRPEQLRRVCEIALQREDFLVSNREFAQRQEALFYEKEFAQTILQSIADGVITTGIEGDIDYMNPVAERVSGWKLADTKGMPVVKVLGGFLELGSSRAYNPIEEVLRTKKTIYGRRKISFLGREGQELKLDHVVSPLRNRQDEVVGAVMVFRDVTQAHKLEKRLEYQAKHDSLTGLINRAGLEDRLHTIIKGQLHHEMDYVICYVDLDQFKVVNDTCGYRAGDMLLREVKDILFNKIRRHRDLLARFGSDEFVLLLEGCDADHANRIAKNICESMQDYRFTYENQTFLVGASIGVVPVFREVNDVNDILRMADNACYLAKEKGRNRVHLYDSNDQELIKRRGEMHVVTKINRSFENDGFTLFYQIIQPADKNVSGTHIEVLLRMHNGDSKWISPGFFLPAAERYNIATKIDRWVLESTLDWFANNQIVLAKLAKCSINLSGLTLSDGEFVDFVISRFQECNLPPDKFCFEITETAAIRNFQEATDFISQIKDIGCSFSLDDFGSGMSSYAYLKNLPVDYLKIDGMFVRSILEDPVNHAMVRSINDIGHVFGLQTIAEYVESEEIKNELYKLGIDFVQGYAIHKPTILKSLAKSSLDPSFV